MTVAQPSMSDGGKVELSWSVKLLLGVSTLLSTVVATGLGAVINNYFVERQAESSSQQGDVRKLEELIEAGDTAMRKFVVGANGGNVLESDREAAVLNIEQQYALAGRLASLMRSDGQRKLMSKYQATLIDISKQLRKSNSNASLMKLGQAVSNGIDARIAAVDSLRAVVGLPVTHRDADATEPVSNFGAVVTGD